MIASFEAIRNSYKNLQKSDRMVTFEIKIYVILFIVPMFCFVPQSYDVVMNSTALMEQLVALPAELALVAVGGNKAPYLPNWQRSPLTKAQLQSEITAGRCKAVGVLCGRPSNGLLFLDHDGESCDRLIETLSGSPIVEALPQTVGITSGRRGRYQLIYRVPEQHWDAIATRKLKTGESDGKPSRNAGIPLGWVPVCGYWPSPHHRSLPIPPRAKLWGMRDRTSTSLDAPADAD